LTSALTRERVVVDTNALIGRLLLPDSVPARAVHAVVTGAILLSSEATIAELAEVLARKEFDAYASVPDRQQFLRLLSRVTEIVPVTHTVRACRDPRDDKFLELAVNGEATLIVTGDNDLLSLNPFRDIPIITPASYLAR
jgi:putative PIN family toxin of toxin-antitoxin system